VIIRRPQVAHRRAATAVEFAIVSSATLVMLIGVIVGALGVFRYQEVARLAREGARYAAVRGEAYSRATGQPTAVPADVHANVVLPGGVALKPALLSSNVTWSPDKQPGSLVTVTVNYKWLPEAFFGVVMFSSTATMPVTY
jgi:hypothetical protein